MNESAPAKYLRHSTIRLPSAIGRPEKIDQHSAIVAPQVNRSAGDSLLGHARAGRREHIDPKGERSKREALVIKVIHTICVNPHCCTRQGGEARRYGGPSGKKKRFTNTTRGQQAAKCEKKFC